MSMKPGCHDEPVASTVRSGGVEISPMAAIRSVFNGNVGTEYSRVDGSITRVFDTSIAMDLWWLLHDSRGVLCIRCQSFFTTCRIYGWGAVRL